MNFKDLKHGDTFIYNNKLYVKIHIIQGYNACCITDGEVVFCHPQENVTLTNETRSKYKIVTFKDLSIGMHFVESKTNNKYMKLNVPSKAVNLNNGHIKGFDDNEEVELFKTGIFKND